MERRDYRESETRALKETLESLQEPCGSGAACQEDEAPIAFPQADELYDSVADYDPVLRAHCRLEAPLPRSGRRCQI